MNIFQRIKSWFNRIPYYFYQPGQPGNFGYIHQDPRDTDWIAGVESGVPFQNNIDSGDWGNYLPDLDLQVLNDGKIKWETNACTAFMAANQIKNQANWMLATNQFTQEELDYYILKGYIVNGKFSISPRHIALVAKNDPGKGNTFVNVGDAIRLHQDGSGFGLVPEAMCPKGKNTSEFYTPLTQDVINYGKNFFKYLQINYEFIYSGQCTPDVPTLKYHLKQAPLGIAASVLSGWFGDAVIQYQPICVSQHATEIFKIDDIIHDFDSETITPRKMVLNYPISGVWKLVLRKVQPLPVKPYVTHAFLVNLKLGDNNQEVIFLQDKLKQFNYFPLNVESTGYYKNITKTAVAAFQHAHGIHAEEPGKYCYELTRAELNKI